MSHAPRTRPRARSLALLPALLAVLALGLAGAGAPLVAIEGGAYAPFYPIEGEGPIDVEPFEIQSHAVTNADYLAFVRDHPDWDRGAPPSVFADPAYLARWAGPGDLGRADPGAPSRTSAGSRPAPTAPPRVCACRRRPSGNSSPAPTPTGSTRAGTRPGARTAMLGVRYRPTGNGMFSHSNLITVLGPDGVPLARVEGLGVPNDPLAEAIAAAR